MQMTSKLSHFSLIISCVISYIAEMLLEMVHNLLLLTGPYS